MLIADIKPYARNARQHSGKDLQALESSISEFGLRGKIQLVSPDDPTLVNGHGRVEACRRLGWDEIPDANIEFVGDLTDEQIKAYRIADNKTAEGSRWNRALLRTEVASLKGVDMSKFGCDFKGKLKPYGAARLKTDRAYNLDLVSRADCGPGGMPELAPVDAKPAGMTGFNYAKSSSDADKRGRACHFFIDDYQFERVWTTPGAYLECLRGYDCVLTPDFSLYMDMPAPMQAWNRYRSQALGVYWQHEGLQVVPTLSWAQPESYAFCFDGIPRRSTVAVSTVGAARDKDARAVWFDGMREAMRRLEPSRVLLYGKDIGFDFGGCEVVEYEAGGFHGR